MQRLYRFYEIRQAGDGIIAGTALDYADVADIAGRFKERFEPGSIAWDDVILNIQHDRRSPVARTGNGLVLHHSPESGDFQSRTAQYALWQGGARTRGRWHSARRQYRIRTAERELD